MSGHGTLFRAKRSKPRLKVRFAGWVRRCADRFVTRRGARGVLCLLTDITEVNSTPRAGSAQAESGKSWRDVAGLAHEFKNAIATLHGYAQLLQNLDLDERGQTATSALLNEVRNLSEMINVFLNFARPRPLQCEEVSLSELIDDCADELKPLYLTKRVELILDRGRLARLLPTMGLPTSKLSSSALTSACSARFC